MTTDAEYLRHMFLAAASANAAAAGPGGCPTPASASARHRRCLQHPVSPTLHCLHRARAPPHATAAAPPPSHPRRPAAGGDRGGRCLRLAEQRLARHVGLSEGKLRRRRTLLLDPQLHAQRLHLPLRQRQVVLQLLARRAGLVRALPCAAQVLVVLLPHLRLPRGRHLLRAAHAHLCLRHARTLLVELRLGARVLLRVEPPLRLQRRDHLLQLLHLLLRRLRVGVRVGACGARRALAEFVLEADAQLRLVVEQRRQLQHLVLQVDALAVHQLPLALRTRHLLLQRRRALRVLPALDLEVGCALVNALRGSFLGVGVGLSGFSGPLDAIAGCVQLFVLRDEVELWKNVVVAVAFGIA
eukprot:Rhum_TRINITY_DN14894_c6_g2::Rhum_TRINITY_DN14894_c6_g2_i1::g.126027::m.126027